MPNVRFHPSRKSIEIASGKTLYEAAREAGLPVASSCDAEFTCGKCNMEILEGAENVSPQDEAERHLLQRQGRPVTDRVSCRTKVFGDCKVTTSYW